MKSPSKKFIRHMMDQNFLSYCYRVSALTADYTSEKMAIESDQVEEDEKKRLLDHLEEEFNQKVKRASKSFNKGVAYWAYLYGNGGLPNE